MGLRRWRHVVIKSSIYIAFLEPNIAIWLGFRFRSVGGIRRWPAAGTQATSQMPVTEHRRSTGPFAAAGSSFFSNRAMEGHDSGFGGVEQQQLEDFQRRVADLFHGLSSATGEGGEVMSISWLRQLLDVFIVCLEEFRAVLFNRSNLVAQPPLDRMVSEFFERAVKALDVCNAVRDGVGQVRRWREHLEIVFLALGPSLRGGGSAILGEGQVRRAEKALTDLTILMIDEKEGAGSSALAHRNRSFGRSERRSSSGGRRFRSLSWSVSPSWSAARQLQAIAGNVAAPRGHEVVATGGLAVVVYTMSSVLAFVTWALVAAIPCQDRGLQAQLSLPRSFSWAAPIMSLQERILEESKRKDRRSSSGLLAVIHQTQRCVHRLAELLVAAELPLTDEKEREMRQELEELAQVCEAMQEGLDPLERQVREVFLRIARSRTEGLDFLPSQC